MWYVINAGIIIALLVLTGAVLWVVREFFSGEDVFGVDFATNFAIIVTWLNSCGIVYLGSMTYIYGF